MEPMYYIGLDVHKKKIGYSVKERGEVHALMSIPANPVTRTFDKTGLWANLRINRE